MPNGRRELTPRLITARLTLRRVELADAAFFVRLLNEPSWIANIGDRDVHSEVQAEAYIRARIWSQYDTCGFGMYVVQALADAVSMGLCGLVRRDELPGPDLGFALLPEWVGRGYVTEAATAVVAHAEGTLAIKPLYAITRRTNQRSIGVLTRVGFRREGPFPVPPDAAEIELYVRP